MFRLNAFGQYNRPMDEADGAGGGGGWQSKTDPESGYTTYSLDGVRKKFGQDVYSNPNIVWGSPSLMYGGEDGTTASDLSTIKTIGGVDPSAFKATYSGDRYYTMGQNGPEEAVMLQDGSNAIVPKSLAEQYLTPEMYRSTKDVQDTSSMFEKMMPMAAAALVTYLTGGAGAGVANSMFGAGALGSAASGALAAGVTGQNPVYGAVLGGMKGALPSMGGSGVVGDSVSGSSVYDPMQDYSLVDGAANSGNDYAVQQMLAEGTADGSQGSLAQQLLNSGAPLPEGLKTALQTGGSLLPFANQIRSIVGTASSLLGGSGGTSTSGATRSPGGLPGQTNIIAPSNAMLSFAPAPKAGSFTNQQSDNTSTLFSGLNPEQSRIQVPNAPVSNAAPLQMAEFSDYAPIQKTVPIPVAHGGLMHFEDGGAVPENGSNKSIEDLNKKIAEILAQKGAKATSSDDQIQDYLRRSQDSNARLDFLSPLASRMMRGRPSRPEAMYSGLQQPSVTGAAPAMGYSARPVQPLQQSPSIVNMARIPFAAHGGEIHPHLASVLADRNFEINKEMIPGPEGRYYARHEQRGFAVGGPGTGQSDDIPTMLSDGEYVIDADTVAALGDGSSKAGASVLDKFRQQIRQHKRSAPTNDIPPKAKSPMEYMKMARKGK